MVKQITNYFLEAVHSLTIARLVPSKRLVGLQTAQACVLDVQMLLRICKYQKYITREFYRELDELLSESKELISKSFR